MYLLNNYVDINIYPLTMNVMPLWACLYGKGAISNDNIIIIIIIAKGRVENAWLYHWPLPNLLIFARRALNNFARDPSSLNPTSLIYLA